MSFHLEWWSLKNASVSLVKLSEGLSINAFTDHFLGRTICSRIPKRRRKEYRTTSWQSVEYADYRRSKHSTTLAPCLISAWSFSRPAWQDDPDTKTRGLIVKQRATFKASSTLFPSDVLATSHVTVFFFRSCIRVLGHWLTLPCASRYP